MITPAPSPQVRVKICGLTTRADALAAIDAGADALGFNGWAGSKRHIDLIENAGWIRDLPPFVDRWAVLVNPEIEDLQRLARTLAFDGVQLHGDETPEFCKAAGDLFRSVMKAIRVAASPDLDAAGRFPTSVILVDSPAAAGVYGGTGVPADWSLVSDFVQSGPPQRVVLAGGLTPQNVADAVRAVRPFGVDVASGVEVDGAPRQKDPGAIRAFICNARQAACP